MSNLADGFPEEAAGSLPEHAFQYDPKHWVENILFVISESELMNHIVML